MSVYLYMYSLDENRNKLKKRKFGKYFLFYDVEIAEEKILNELEVYSLKSKGVVVLNLSYKSKLDVKTYITMKNTMYLGYLAGHWAFTVENGRYKTQDTCIIHNNWLSNLRRLDAKVLEGIECYIPKIEKMQKRMDECNNIKRKLLGLPSGFGTICGLYRGLYGDILLVEMESVITERLDFYNSVLPKDLVIYTTKDKIKGKSALRFYLIFSRILRPL